MPTRLPPSRWMPRLLLLLAVAAVATGCAERRGERASSASQAAPVTAASVPATVPQRLDQYRLGPGDKLKITVFGQEDISGEFEIGASGDLSMPLVGQIRAENMRVSELQSAITEELDKDFVVDPNVSIQVTNYRPFFILGQVGDPGSYPYQPGMNVRMAVAVGGGYTRRAREEPVTVFRTSADGEQVRFEVDQDAQVLPGDTIEVHRRLF